MLTKIDAQLSDYDARVGSSLQMISCDPQGRISVEDLEKALAVIKHKPDEEVGHKVIEKLDADKDGFVELEHVLGLVREEGLGMLPLIIVSVFVANQTPFPQAPFSTTKRSHLLDRATSSRRASPGKRISYRSDPRTISLTILQSRPNASALYTICNAATRSLTSNTPCYQSSA